MNALIGYTGFVGSNLNRYIHFDKLYNSKNITNIHNKNFDTVICAGISGTKWIANKNPYHDRNNIERLLFYSKTIKCKRMILISTVDVYSNKVGVNEESSIDRSKLDTYGANRLYAEEFFKKQFDNLHILRLPALYGIGLKKNYLYDLLNNHCLDWTHQDSIFQYYNLKNLKRDLDIVIKNNIHEINFNSYPIAAAELALECFGIDMNNTKGKFLQKYDIRSIYTHLFNSSSEYMYDKQFVIEDIKDFISNYRVRGKNDKRI